MERATLKIEIPFTDHAHCIGRQGNQIQGIMSATNTHIHFPDGNREPNGTKSNQVSITGAIPSIRQAQKRLKDILPMSLKFLLPSTYSIDHDNPLFQYVRTRFHVIVLSRSYANTGDVYCIVRGLINQSELAEATDYLIQSFYPFQSSLIQVTCQIEVNEHYHVYLQTRQQLKDMSIASIEEYTHTTIEFPKIGSERRTSVMIKGTPTQVCQARKFFDLCLPVILTFEVPRDKEPTRAEIMYMKEQLNVTMIIRTRKEKFGKFITLQTQEYNNEQLFHARWMIHQNSPTDLSIPMTSTISTEQIDTLFIPVKKLSPIGYERSSSWKTFDQEMIVWPTDTDQQNASHDNQLNPLSSTKLLTFLRSMKSCSTFECNEIFPWSIDNEHLFSPILDDVNMNIANSLLSI